MAVSMLHRSFFDVSMIAYVLMAVSMFGGTGVFNGSFDVRSGLFWVKFLPVSPSVWSKKRTDKQDREGLISFSRPRNAFRV